MKKKNGGGQKNEKTKNKENDEEMSQVLFSIFLKHFFLTKLL